jgi:hypothetical protein
LGHEGDPELELEPETGTGARTGTELELGTVLKLEPVLEPETVLEPEMGTEVKQSNKYSALHPWHESVVRRKTAQGESISLESRAGACYFW